VFKGKTVETGYHGRDGEGVVKSLSQDTHAWGL